MIDRKKDEERIKEFHKKWYGQDSTNNLTDMQIFLLQTRAMLLEYKQKTNKCLCEMTIEEIKEKI